MKLTIEIPDEHTPALIAALTESLHNTKNRLEEISKRAESALRTSWLYDGKDHINGLMTEIAALAKLMPHVEPKAAIGAPQDQTEPPEYRLLTNGEIIEDGDEYCDYTGNWKLSACIGDVYSDPKNHLVEHHLPHRRKAKPPQDPTRRDLPMPEELADKLPPLPEDKTRWVYRGTFGDVDCDDALRYPDRHIRFFNGRRWFNTDSFSEDYHHIEAI